MKGKFTKLLVVLAVVVLGATLITPPSPASATDNGTPFPGNAHWYRPAGYQAVVYYRVDASAKSLHPLLADSVDMWNEDSPYMILSLVPLGGNCPSGSHCITLAENNAASCGSSHVFVDWYETSTYHRHFKPMLIAGNWADTCPITLLQLKYKMCHQVGITQGVKPGADGIRPCSPGDGRPTQNDKDIRNYLGVVSE